MAQVLRSPAAPGRCLRRRRQPPSPAFTLHRNSAHYLAEPVSVSPNLAPLRGLSRRTELHRPALVVVVPAPLRAYDFGTLGGGGGPALSLTARMKKVESWGWLAPEMIVVASVPTPCNCSRAITTCRATGYSNCERVGRPRTATAGRLAAVGEVIVAFCARLRTGLRTETLIIMLGAMHPKLTTKPYSNWLFIMLECNW